MSWWKAALGIGGLAAAPFTAGTSAAWAVPLITGGLSTIGQIYGSRQQGNANRRAMQVQERASQQAMELDREQEATRRAEFQAQQQQLQRQWDATQKFEADKWAVLEEERLYDRRLKEERETRMAPRRAASAQALANLPGILEHGRTSPGLASLGSYRSK